MLLHIQVFSFNRQFKYKILERRLEIYISPIDISFLLIIATHMNLLNVTRIFVLLLLSKLIHFSILGRM